MSEKIENINLKEIEQKVYRNEYLDGFTFVLLGFILILTAFIINLHPLFMILLAVAFISCFPISKIFRSRYTYPRLGYFKVKTEDPKKLFPGMFLFSFIVISASLILLLVFSGDDPRVLYDFENWYEFLPILFGVIMFGPSLDMVDKTGQKIYYWLGAYSTILGLLIVWLNFQPPKIGFSIYLILLGVSSCVFGGISFVRFVKNYPIIDETEPPRV